MWLIKQEVAEQIRRAHKAAPVPTAAQLERFSTRCEADGAAAAANGQPRSLKVAGDTAEILIEGVLTPKMDFWLWLFDIANTTYADVQAALALAAQDPAIKKVVLKIASPGGMVDGLFDTLAVLEAFPKPISVRASLAASAAYSIAAMGGRIEATNAAAEFGSIGVAVTYLLDEELVDITSTEAPNKRPDPSTDEGKAVIREHLDAIHDLFVDAIARGRSKALGETLTKDTVNETFGRGAVLLAAESKKRKMIDKAPAAAPRGARAEGQATPLAAGETEETATGGEDMNMPDPKPATATFSQPITLESKPMDLKTLKAQFPDVYEAAVKEGVTLERDRVVGHLTMGEQCGDMKTAIAAIQSGDGMTVTLTAKYMSAAMNRRDSNARQADSDAAGAAVDGAKKKGSSGGGDGSPTSLLDTFAADLPPTQPAA